MKITKRVRDYTFPWYSDQQLVSIFQQECIEIISTKISDWEERCENVKKEIRGVLNEAEKISKKDIWFVEILVAKLLLPHLYEYQRHIWRLNRLLKTSEDKGEFIESFKEKIERARASPIYEVARDKLEIRQSGKNFVALCPYHDEKTPSCYFYIGTNTFYCFGCNEKGDVIKLKMDLHGFKFKEAVEFLQN